MSTAEQKGRLLSVSEDSLFSNIKCDPVIQSPPFSDVHPFPGQTERNVVPHVLSGCAAQVQPSSSAPHTDDNRLNGISTSAWSTPVLGQPEGKPYSSRIMRLFSNSRKSPAPESSSTAHSNDGNSNPQSWIRLPGLGVVDSFKKLRSSVLQGIQSRGSSRSDGEFAPSCNKEMSNGTNVTRFDCGVNDAANDSHLDGYNVSKENVIGQTFAAISQCDSDIEDYEDEENHEGDGLKRGSRFSRSIRRAYGVGRISLVDIGNGRFEESGTHEPVYSQKASQRSEVLLQPQITTENTNVSVLTRLSKSAENLHVFRVPLMRKAPSPGPPLTQEDYSRTSVSNGIPNIQRTASASSVELQALRKNPMKASGQMVKLVGSMSDLTAGRRRSPSPTPTNVSPLSPLSRLHDDYSRRVPCLSASERQRRPLPVRTKLLEERTVNTEVCNEYTPLVHLQPDFDICPNQVLLNLVSSNDICTPSESLEVTSVSVCAQETELNSPLLRQNGSLQRQEQTEVTLLPNEAMSEQEPHLQSQEDSTKFCITPPVSPTSLSHTDESTDTSAVKQRRRTTRPRPRPLSDFGQLACRKHLIPEEEAELCVEERTDAAFIRCSDGCDRQESLENCSVDSDVQIRRLRPVSVIGVVDTYAAGADKDDSLPSPVSRPPIPSHRVPPYRGVSARFRPSALSQSTPIGLDRVGRHKLQRVLSDGVSESLATLDDSVSEEEEGSYESYELTDVPPYLEPEVELSMLNQWINSGHTVYAEALWDHVTMEEQELAFKAGDVIRVLDAFHKDWWWGRGVDREAWFPSSFVRLRVNQEDSSGGSVESVADQEDPPLRDTLSSRHHKDQMRTNVVQEIMNTERVYIKHLRDICEGYIRQCHKNPEMFTELQLKTIFSNIEDIYRFQRQFLRDLEKKYNKDQPHLSEIGSCFVSQGEAFSVYSEYCNTHPAACAELQRLMKLSRYKHFFEACRLLQQMINISITGFLLTPVQKICKYPLQLGELLKYTTKEHSDYSSISDAYKTMKNVASLINERKRRLESVDTIAHWQVSILHWEGPDVLERSSDLIYSGEINRIIRQGKMQQRSFFLFDHQLIFCKKDVLRRDLLHYRGRLDMDETEVVDVPDGREPDLGMTLKSALLLRHASTLQNVCVLCCRKAEDKQRWLQAFAKERDRVKEDQEMGMEISEEQRKQAIINARRAKQGKIKTMGYSGSVPPHQQNLHPLHQRHVTIPTSVPQQQVFSLAEPPKRKPYHLLYSITRNTFFRK